MKTNRLLFALLLLLSISGFSQKAEIFSVDGKAIRGFDVVAFFKAGKAVKGYDSIVVDWNNAKWFFENKANAADFAQTPGKYAPQFGGYCAYGTAQGHKAPTQTDTWTIVDNKLYFNYNTKVKEIWTKNQSELIKKAEVVWPTIKDKE
ncbi:MAG: YHS domain protein [Chitinophaga sp.]|jgi:hypothetical protein|nr:YHS domain protein [Chitinophaga sp.]